MKKVYMIAMLGILLSLGVAHASFFGDLLGLTQKYSIVRAPEFVLDGVKKLGVEGFSGETGDIFANALITELKNPKRSGPLPGERSRDEASAVSPPDADLNAAPMYETGLKLDVFEIVHGSTDVDAVVTGTMETVGPTDSHYTAKVVTRDAAGHRSEREVGCTKREANLTVRMTIKKAADGSILVSKALSLGTSASACEGDGRAIPSGDAMFQGLGKVIAPQLVNFFAPFFNALPIDLQKDDVTKKACECAKNKEWDKAVAKWLDVLATDEYNYAALYDLGIANEIFGNYDKAIEYYKKAEVASSHKRNKEAIERVEARKIEVDRLKSYGLAIQPHAFENVSATTVVLRGSSSDRHPLYEQPDKTSKVITRLPGGMSVTVIGTEGDWCKIRTPDGREGYVLREELKFN